jgi:hypothetical protein
VVVRADAPAPKIVALIYVGDKQMCVFARRTLALQKRPLLHALARLFREEYQEFLRVGVNEFRVSSEGNAHRP